MLRYETHSNTLNQIFNLINSGRYYSMTFVKKGDGNIRYLNGHRHIYQKPNGTDDVAINVGYDPKDHNLIRIWDRNAENYITKQRTGNYRSAALENIIFIKCGNELFDFVEENQITKRFPYIDERKLEEIRSKMKIETTEPQNLSEDLDKTDVLKNYLNLLAQTQEQLTQYTNKSFQERQDQNVENNFKLDIRYLGIIIKELMRIFP